MVETLVDGGVLGDETAIRVEQIVIVVVVSVLIESHTVEIITVVSTVGVRDKRDILVKYVRIQSQVEVFIVLGELLVVLLLLWVEQRSLFPVFKAQTLKMLLKVGLLVVQEGFFESFLVLGGHCLTLILFVIGFLKNFYDNFIV